MEGSEELLEQAFINQIERDMNDKDWSSLSELISNLIYLEPAKKLLVNYLSDEERERWIEGRTETRY